MSRGRLVPWRATPESAAADNTFVALLGPLMVGGTLAYEGVWWGVALMVAEQAVVLYLVRDLLRDRPRYDEGTPTEEAPCPTTSSS